MCLLIQVLIFLFDFECIDSACVIARLLFTCWLSNLCQKQNINCWYKLIQQGMLQWTLEDSLFVIVCQVLNCLFIQFRGTSLCFDFADQLICVDQFIIWQWHLCFDNFKIVNLDLTGKLMVKHILFSQDNIGWVKSFNYTCCFNLDLLWRSCNLFYSFTLRIIQFSV